VNEDDVDIEVKDRVLTISGERRDEHVRIPKPEETQPTRVQIGKRSAEGSGKQK
jgi:hypothetical protein